LYCLYLFFKAKTSFIYQLYVLARQNQSTLLITTFRKQQSPISNPQADDFARQLFAFAIECGSIVVRIKSVRTTLFLWIPLVDAPRTLHK